MAPTGRKDSYFLPTWPLSPLVWALWEESLLISEFIPTYSVSHSLRVPPTSPPLLILRVFLLLFPPGMLNTSTRRNINFGWWWKWQHPNKTPRSHLYLKKKNKKTPATYSYLATKPIKTEWDFPIPRVIVLFYSDAKEGFLKCAILGVMERSGNRSTREAKVEANQGYVARCCGNKRGRRAWG